MLPYLRPNSAVQVVDQLCHLYGGREMQEWERRTFGHEAGPDDPLTMKSFTMSTPAKVLMKMQSRYHRTAHYSSTLSHNRLPPAIVGSEFTTTQCLKFWSNQRGSTVVQGSRPYPSVPAGRVTDALTPGNSLDAASTSSSLS